MATLQEQEQLMEVLKFTPRTYRISMWGYGGERVMGTVDRKIYDYFKQRRLDLSDYAWNDSYAEENNIPKEMRPFYPGSWYECDDMGHVSGVSKNSGTIQIDDENGESIFEQSLYDCNGLEGPEISTDEEVWIDEKPAGTIVFVGASNEKGTFFEGQIELTAPFNIEKLMLSVVDFDGEDIVVGVTYNGEDINNYGGSTDGKSSDFGFYVAHSQETSGSWEMYRNMDDIEYPMTEWFPKKIKPVRKGLYTIKTAGKNSYTHQAMWNGEKWTSTYDANELKIKEWQGLAVDPDAEVLGIVEEVVV